jgi:tetratricopeptide (TPR) repeat protein
MVAASSLAVAAEDYVGADAVLKRISEAGAKPDAKTDPASAVLAAVEAYRRDAGQLPPDQAAERWVALLDSYAGIPFQQMYDDVGSGRLRAETLFQALPPVEAWDALGAAVKKKAAAGPTEKRTVLRLLAAVLANDGPERDTVRDGLRKEADQAAKDETVGSQRFRGSTSSELLRALESFSLSEKDLALRFEQSLGAAEKERDPSSGFYGQIQVPDLVKASGGKKAEALILRALKVGADLQVEGEETRKLAVEVALKNVQDLKKPVWGLVAGSDEMALYEALAKKFPPTREDFSRSRADAVYLIALINAGRTDEASAHLRKIAKSKNSQLELSWISRSRDGRAAVQPQRLVAFLETALGSDPSLPLWDDYISLAARNGRAKEALALLHAALQKPDLTAQTRAELQRHLSSALLAGGELEEGIGALREVIRGAPKPAQEKADSDATAREESTRAKQEARLRQHQAAVRLTQIGRLLERPELIDEALAAIRANLPALAADGVPNLRELTRVLIELKRGAEAERLVLDVLLAQQASDRSGGGSGGPEKLTELARIYDAAGRSADVLRLLDGAPQWGAADLGEIGDFGGEESNLLSMAARALLATGRAEDARRVARRAVQNTPGQDSAYAILLQAGGDDVETVLDRASRRDRFQERPLIWKAQLALNRGAAPEAEKLARAAIAIDPSDGEEGKGDRMRAYAVLAEALEKKGDAAQARLMGEAVAAIRLSEDADDWWQAGLLTKAVEKYEAALNRFADAYCIQSRLALRYGELGDYEKAELHYRRAFELMPESFGRVESHCFGCEHAFEGQRAQGVAERVFTTLARKLPDHAQVYYLLGYLRTEQGRAGDAAESFRKAVQLDPDYLNAWQRLLQLAEKASLPPEELEQAALTILRLDPTGAHVHADLQHVHDLRRLWSTILAADAAIPPKEKGPIYPLAAAKQELAAPGRRGYEWRSRGGGELEDARSAITQHPLLGALAQSLDAVLHSPE